MGRAHSLLLASPPAIKMFEEALITLPHFFSLNGQRFSSFFADVGEIKLGSLLERRLLASNLVFSHAY